MAVSFRFIKAVVFGLLAEMLDGVDGVDEESRYQKMFSQWLQPRPGAKEGNPDATYHIVESLLDVRYSIHNESGQPSMPWQMSDVDAVGTMKVVRVSDVKTGGRHFVAMLESFLRQTAQDTSSGPVWSGMIEVDEQGSSSKHRIRWSLFAVIKDFSQDEPSKKLQQNVPNWFLRRRLCRIHPAIKASPEVRKSETAEHNRTVCCPLWQKLSLQSRELCLPSCHWYGKSFEQQRSEATLSDIRSALQPITCNSNTV